MRQRGLSLAMWAGVGSCGRAVIQVTVLGWEQILCFLRAGVSFFHLAIWEVVIFGHLVLQALRMLESLTMHIEMRLTSNWTTGASDIQGPVM
jgi:hypothetical protein